MKKSLISMLTFAGLLAGCGDGNTNTTNQNYYSASSSSYYQIATLNSSNESGSSTTYALNIVTNTGNSVNNLPLTPTSNGYSFAGNVNGAQATGSIVIKNGQMGFAINSSNSNYADFATVNSNTNAIPDGMYTTVCDQNNLSACTIQVSTNKITITEYSISGTATVLCSNQLLTQAPSSALNPYLYSFSCGVQAGSSTGTWYIMPLLINNTTGIMVSEFNASSNSSDDQTDEIAFPQATFSPNGSYSYVYNGNASGQAGISSATLTNSSVTNTTVGTCSGASCALIQGQYGGTVGMTGNIMTGFDYYSVNGTTNYNLVGSSLMNIYVDSYVGIYF